MIFSDSIFRWIKGICEEENRAHRAPRRSAAVTLTMAMMHGPDFSLRSPSLYVEENEQGPEDLGIHNIMDPEGARCFQQLLLNKS
jgi:hypothetical protein